jgi:hypothetical protein
LHGPAEATGRRFLSRAGLTTASAAIVKGGSRSDQVNIAILH